MNHVLGIDAGGTKTVCLLADEEGHLLAEARGEGANLTTEGELSVEKVLHTVMEEVLGDRDVAPAAVCLGIAGVDRPEDSRTLRAIMQRMGYRKRVLIVNDAVVALTAAVEDGPGIVLVAGTGSIAYGRDDANHAARSGGWGHLLADEGSGFWIGREALRAVMRQADGRGPATSLTPRIFDRFGADGPWRLGHAVYSRDTKPQAIASLAEIVGAAASEGDEVASVILARAVAELMLAARSVAIQLGLQDRPFPYVLVGGIFRAVPWLARELARQLPEVAPSCTVRSLDVEPAVGAVRLALMELAGGARLPEYR